MVIFTKNDDAKFRNVIESLSSVSLGIHTTLILYEKDAKHDSSSLSHHHIRLLLRKDPAEMAGLISGYFKAFNMAKGKY